MEWTLICSLSLILISACLTTIWITSKRMFRNKCRDVINGYISEYNDWMCKIAGTSEKVLSIVNSNLTRIDMDTYNTIKCLLEDSETVIVLLQQQFISWRSIDKSKWQEYEQNICENLDELDKIYGKFLYFEKQLQNIMDEKCRWNNFKREQDRKKAISTKPHEISLFAGCSTKQEISKRYRLLAKKYHPDNGGDSAMFQKVQAEYQKYVKGAI